MPRLAALVVGLGLLAGVRAEAATLGLRLAPGETARPCTSTQVAQAIQARRPDLHVVAETGPDAAAEVHADIALEAGTWILHVTSNAPVAALRRELPPPGRDCEELSQTAALMIARYLEDIRAATGPVAIQPIVHLPPVPPPPLLAVLELGGGVGSGQISTVPAFTLDLAARRGRYQLGLSGAIGTRQGEAIIDPNPIPGSTAHATLGAYALLTGRVEVVLDRRFPLGPGTLSVGAVAGAEISRVSASGPYLFVPTPATVLSPEVGYRVAYELSLPWRLGLGLRGEGREIIQQNSYSVPGAGTLQSPRYDGDVVATISRTFF